MRPRDGASIRIEYPVKDDVVRAVVAEKAAKTRNSVKALFPNDERYMTAFKHLHAKQAIAAFFGERVVGVILFKRDGREPFVISRSQFLALWGRVHGTWLWCVFQLSQWLQGAPETYCCAVWVHPVWRAHGVGGRLYSHLIERTDGAVHALARRDAVEFHRQAGFREDRAL